MFAYYNLTKSMMVQHYIEKGKYDALYACIIKTNALHNACDIMIFYLCDYDFDKIWYYVINNI